MNGPPQSSLGPQTCFAQDDKGLGRGECFPTLNTKDVFRMGHPGFAEIDSSRRQKQILRFAYPNACFVQDDRGLERGECFPILNTKDVFRMGHPGFVEIDSSRRQKQILRFAYPECVLRAG